MRIPFTNIEISTRKDLSQIPTSAGGGWFPLIREHFTGAWQRNREVKLDDVLAYWAVFRCISIISSDISKLGLRLLEHDGDDIWLPSAEPAFTPVLRRPNRYQNRIQFFAHWLESKLTHGNAYILKEYDLRNVVRAMYVLHPWRVRPLVSEDGSVFYELRKDNLASIEEGTVTVPAGDIIHDRWNTLFHPLVGLSPLYAAGVVAMTGQNIARDSAEFFENNSQPSGVLTAPNAISNETAERLKKGWEDFKAKRKGDVLVAGDGLKYEQMRMSAVDSQLIEQQKLSVDAVAGAYGVPSYMLNGATLPSHNNVQALTLQYYSQCLQPLIEAVELCLDEGLHLTPQKYRTEFDLEDLLRMDTATRVKAATDAIKGGLSKPNEERARFNRRPVEGGDQVFLQQQNYSLAALAKRDAKEDPFASASAAPPAAAEPETGDDSEEEDESLSGDEMRAFLIRGAEMGVDAREPR